MIYDTLGRNEALSSWDLDNALIGVLLGITLYIYIYIYLLHLKRFYDNCLALVPISRNYDSKLDKTGTHDTFP